MPPEVIEALRNGPQASGNLIALLLVIGIPGGVVALGALIMCPFFPALWFADHAKKNSYPAWVVNLIGMILFTAIVWVPTLFTLLFATDLPRRH